VLISAFVLGTTVVFAPLIARILLRRRLKPEQPLRYSLLWSGWR